MNMTTMESTKMNKEKSDIMLSVIVPCYNVEPYLDRSLGSLERQWNGRTDYEIILVNDASSDGTINKLNEFRDRYPENVIVIDKQVNGGVAQARNSGLDIARGKWIAFFDPDDALVDNSYSRLLDLIKREHFDILSFEAKVVKSNEWEDGLMHAGNVDFSIEWSGTGQDYMLENSIGVCFKYLYNSRIIANRRFPQLTIGEDTVFVLPIFLNGVSVAKTKSVVYQYIIRSSSATNMIDATWLSKGCDDILTAIQFMDEYKQRCREDLKNRIQQKQELFSVNLITRLLLSRKDISEVKRHQAELQKMSLLPLDGVGIMVKVYNLLINNPWLLVTARPMYRLIRSARMRFN